MKLRTEIDIIGQKELLEMNAHTEGLQKGKQIREGLFRQMEIVKL
jgi:hypothetical protein